MSTSRPIYWHHGMFLQPQHFQMSELHQQSQARPYREFVQPYLWGVSSLSMQTSSLSQRICDIDGGEFLFPDGSFVELPGNALIHARSFADEWVDQEKPFTIYIALKKLSRFEDNATEINDMSELGAVKTRFVAMSNPEEVRDIYKQNATAGLVKSLNYVLRVVWENEKDELTDYQFIPVAQVIRDGDVIKFDSSFCPPVIKLSASQTLVRKTKEVRDEIVGRYMQLDSYKLHESREFDPNMLRYKLAQQALSRFIPRLFHHTDAGNTHPWNVYGVLRELVGEISIFTDRVNVLGETRDGKKLLPAYDHTSLGRCFEDAHELITQLLNEVTIGPKHLVEMEFDGGSFSAGIPNEFFDGDNDFYLVINTSNDFNDYQHSLLTAAKLATRDTVHVLVERSLPGVGLIHVPFAPPGLPRRPNTYYVRLDKHGERWSSLARSHDVALLWKEAPDDAKLELVVLRR